MGSLSPIHDSILKVLSPTVGLNAVQIVKQLRIYERKQINKVLYDLLGTGEAIKNHQNNPPLWFLAANKTTQITTTNTIPSSPNNNTVKPEPIPQQQHTLQDQSRKRRAEEEPTHAPPPHKDFASKFTENPSNVIPSAPPIEATQSEPHPFHSYQFLTPIYLPPYIESSPTLNTIDKNKNNNNTPTIDNNTNNNTNISNSLANTHVFNNYDNNTNTNINTNNDFVTTASPDSRLQLSLTPVTSTHPKKVLVLDLETTNYDSLKRTIDPNTVDCIGFCGLTYQGPKPDKFFQTHSMSRSGIDCFISFHLGLLIGRGEISSNAEVYIVSHESGISSVVDEAKKFGVSTKLVSRVEDIANVEI